MRRWFFIQKAILAFAIATCVACGSDRHHVESDCATILQSYDAALTYALNCDPAVANSCDAGRPILVKTQLPDGQTQILAVCEAPCLGAVNPQHTSDVDLILQSYRDQGCPFSPCPCPPPSFAPAQCSATGSCVGLWAPPP